MRAGTIWSMENEFAPATENQALKERIIARIRDEGPITFRDFMAMALYEPRLGYYCSGRETMGRDGDYLTSPEVSPIFSAMVGRQLPIFSLIVPFWLIWAYAGFRRTLEIWPALLVGAISIPLGLRAFLWAERYAKRTGRLKRSG